MYIAWTHFQGAAIKVKMSSAESLTKELIQKFQASSCFCSLKILWMSYGRTVYAANLSSQDHHHHYHPSSPNSAATVSSDTFGEQHQDTTPSQYTQNNNNNNNFNPTQYEYASFALVPGSTSLFKLMMGPHLAPERVAFKIYTEPFSSLGSAATSPSISGNNNTGSSNMASTTTTTTTRSWKPYNTTNNVSSSSSSSSSASLPLPILDQVISPLTSPWLGARPTSEIGNSVTKGGSSRNGNGGRPLSSTSLLLSDTND